MRFLRRKTHSLISKTTEFPAGTFVKTEKGYFYIAGPGRRFRILSKRVLDSWNPPRVVNATEAAVSKYRITSRLKFRNGSLIHNIADGKVYLIVGGKRCPMVSPEAFERIGAARDYDHITTVSLDEINLHELGDPIS